jgi:hypothetical protein
MTEPISVLVASSIKNSLTSKEQIDYWRKNLFSDTTLTDQQVLDALDSILSNTTIKRACCLGKADGDFFNVDVRIPIPPDYSENVSDINKKLGYIDKTVKVPKTMCNYLQSPKGLTTYEKPTSPDFGSPCDDFYSLYCANTKAMYDDEYKNIYPGKNPDFTTFSNGYKKECACFNRSSSFPSNNLSPLCLLYPNCTQEDSKYGDVYLDVSSRKTCPSNVSLCVQAIDSIKTKPDSINVSPDLKDYCRGIVGWDSVGITGPPGTTGTSGGTAGTKPPGSKPTGGATGPTGNTSGTTSTPEEVSYLGIPYYGWIIIGIVVLPIIIVCFIVIIYYFMM